MARPLCKKCVGNLPEVLEFIPNGVEIFESNILEPEEFEALRLFCNDGVCNMKDGAKRMNISASTFYRLKASALTKIVDSLQNAKGIKIKDTCEID